jgi:hypothetical protein
MSRARLYPPSVDQGFPVLPPQPEGWQRTTFGTVVEVVERPVKLDPNCTYKLVTAKRNGCGSFTSQLDRSKIDHLTSFNFGRRGGSGLGTTRSA